MLFKSFVFTLCVIGSLFAEVTVDTVWGPALIQNPVIEKLLDHPVLLRLKKIDQSGPLPYFNKAPFFSRYEHSIGVLVLLQKAKAPLKEQVAGLFHDASHTAFSHVGDHLFHESNQEHSYQDCVHLSFLQHMDIEPSIKEFMCLKEMDPDLPCYTALECAHPDICADRLQYILHTGVMYNKISKKDAKRIIDDIQFDGRKWYFLTPEVATLFSNLSIDFTKDHWGSPWNFAFYECFSACLKRAINLNLITFDDVKYGTDESIMKILRLSNDDQIKYSLKLMQTLREQLVVTPFGQGQGTWNVKPKCRAVDPFVKTNKGFQRLSELDPTYKKRLLSLKQWCQEGYGVRLK
jgi:HD superfamily phosphohydrolase